jgi:hypothetical protein
MESKGEGKKNERNTWKIVSIAFILVFVSVIAWGILSVRSAPEFSEPSEDQVGFARSIVASDLQGRGDSIENYEVIVTNRVVGYVGHDHMEGGMHGPGFMGCPAMMNCYRRNVQVALMGNSSAYLYIVDMEEGKIVMRTFTEWMDD